MSVNEGATGAECAESLELVGGADSGLVFVGAFHFLVELVLSMGKCAPITVLTMTQFVEVSAFLRLVPHVELRYL